MYSMYSYTARTILMMCPPGMRPATESGFLLDWADCCEGERSDANMIIMLLLE